MFNVATNIIAFGFVLGVMIFIHELGHYMMAKAFGIGVDVFSLGFGKRLFGFRHGETDYRVSIVPMGGYVKMRGENPGEELTGAPDEYLGRPKWQRFLVLVMGPVMNVALAFALFTTVYATGVVQAISDNDPVVLGWIAPDQPASEAGLLKGDRIVAIDGESMPDWETFRVRILISAEQELSLDLLRDGKRIEVPLTPKAQGPSRIGFIGVSGLAPPVVERLTEGGLAAAADLREADLIVAVDGTPTDHVNEVNAALIEADGAEVEMIIERRGSRHAVRFVAPRDASGNFPAGFAWGTFETIRYPIAEAAARAGSEMWRQTQLVGEIVSRLFTGRMSIRTLSGPVEIGRLSGAAARTGEPSILLSFMAFISLQLGLLNVLPIPLLDGGQIALLGFEGLTRRDLSMAVKERIMQVGFILIVTLMAVVLTLDITKNLPTSWLEYWPF